jgi:hypothetical protein
MSLEHMVYSVRPLRRYLCPRVPKSKIGKTDRCYSILDTITLHTLLHPSNLNHVYLILAIYTSFDVLATLHPPQGGPFSIGVLPSIFFRED